MKGGGIPDGRDRRRLVVSALQGAASRQELEALIGSLGAAVRAGDGDAAEQLAELVYRLPYVRTAVNRVLFDEASVEEALQETALAVVNSISGFRGQSRYSTWITSIARHKAINLLEARRRRSELVLDLGTDGGDIPGPEARTFSSLLVGRLDLDAMLGDLPPKLADVVRLRDVEQLSYEEIAASLDIKLNTVRSRLARGRARLGPAISLQARR